MITWAIVPVKPLRRGKSRLASVFPTEQRIALNRYLLTHTLQTLQQVPEIEHTLVISRDSEALALARQYGARTVSEAGNSHLNLALARAAYLAQAAHVPALLVVPADLPSLQAADLQAMLALADPGPTLVIAPDHRQEGTNLLLLRPPGLISFQFGENSFQRHRDQARQAGARVEVIERPGLLYDLDDEEDLASLRHTLPPDFLTPAMR